MSFNWNSKEVKAKYEGTELEVCTLCERFHIVFECPYCKVLAYEDAITTPVLRAIPCRRCDRVFYVRCRDEI